MIWATLSSRSCFCWLYRASPSLAAKNIINLISVLTIWWCPCRVFSRVVGRGCLLWPVRSLDKTLFPLPCLILYSKAKFACYCRYFLTSYFCIPVPYNEEDIFWVLVLGGLHRTIPAWGIDLDYCDIDWVALETNRDHSVVFEITSLVVQRLKCLPAMWETWVQSLGWEDPLEKEMATHSSILAWRIPWMEELGGLQSMRRKESDTTEQLHFPSTEFQTLLLTMMAIPFLLRDSCPQ